MPASEVVIESCGTRSAVAVPTVQRREVATARARWSRPTRARRRTSLDQTLLVGDADRQPGRRSANMLVPPRRASEAHDRRPELLGRGHVANGMPRWETEQARAVEGLGRRLRGSDISVVDVMPGGPLRRRLRFACPSRVLAWESHVTAAPVSGQDRPYNLLLRRRLTSPVLLACAPSAANDRVASRPTRRPELPVRGERGCGHSPTVITTWAGSAIGSADSQS